MEHVEMKNSLNSKLQIESICSIRILNILEVIGKKSFSKIGKRATLIPICLSALAQASANSTLLDFELRLLAC